MKGCHMPTAKVGQRPKARCHSQNRRQLISLDGKFFLREVGDDILPDDVCWRSIVSNRRQASLKEIGMSIILVANLIGRFGHYPASTLPEHLVCAIVQNGSRKHFLLLHPAAREQR